MKLCFICYEYPPGPHGGVGTFTQMMARALVHAGHEVRVAGVYSASYPAPDYEEDGGVRVWRLRVGKGRFGWLHGRYRQYRLIRNWAARGDIELVEAPDFAGWYAGWPKTSVPLVQRAHGSATYYAHELGQRVQQNAGRLERWSYGRCDAWAAVSEHSGRLTRRLFNMQRGPDAVLRNPVDAPEVIPPFEVRNPHRVVFTGTLTSKKGVMEIGAAWPTVIAEHPAAQLHLYGKDQSFGDGSTTREVFLARLPYALHNTVVFHGHVSRRELWTALMGASVAVFPSFTETFGLGPVESMACGCPTIFTKLSCGPEIVQDGVNGLLVHPGRPEEIAAAILAVLRNPTRAAQLGAEGRRTVLHRYGLPGLTRENESFFTSVVDAFHRSRS